MRRVAFRVAGGRPPRQQGGYISRLDAVEDHDDNYIRVFWRMRNVGSAYM
jgi:hypothetical protein